MSRRIGPWGARFNAEGKRVRLDGDLFAQDLRVSHVPRPGKKTFTPSKYERGEGRSALTFVCLDARGRGVRWSVLRRAVERGWDFFWRKSHRAHLKPNTCGTFLIKHYHVHD